MAAALGEDPIELALRGGEDFELCYTAPPGAITPMVDKFRAQFGTLLTRVGTITLERALQLVHADGSQTLLVPASLRSFPALSDALSRDRDFVVKPLAKPISRV